MHPRTDKTMPAGTSIGLGSLGALRPFLAFLRRRVSLLRVSVLLVWPALALVAAALSWGYVLRDLGHAAGDELLRTVGKRLKLAVRPRDHVVRLGGDEFVVLLEQFGSPEDVEHVARRVLAAFRGGFHLQHATHVLGASIGISLFPEHGEDAQTLLKNADIAMYAVKTEGKGSFCFFQSRFFDAIRTRLEPKGSCGGRSSSSSSWCTTSRAWTWPAAPSRAWRHWCAGSAPARG